MDVYTHLTLNDQKSALDVLPNIPGMSDSIQSEKVALKNTGTDGKLAESFTKKLTNQLTKNSYFDSQNKLLTGNNKDIKKSQKRPLDDCYKSIDLGILDTKKESPASD